MENVFRSLSVVEDEFLIVYAVLSFVDNGSVFGIVRASDESVGTFDSAFIRKVSDALGFYFAGSDGLTITYVCERYDSKSGGFHLIFSDGSKDAKEIVVRADLAGVF